MNVQAASRDQDRGALGNEPRGLPVEQDPWEDTLKRIFPEIRARSIGDIHMARVVTVTEIPSRLGAGSDDCHQARSELRLQKKPSLPLDGSSHISRR